MTAPHTADTEGQPYTFTARELKRLVVYRAAVAAHFYTDSTVDDPIAPRPIRPTVDAARLLRAIRAADPAA
jgi:hypothetical protein